MSQELANSKIYNRMETSRLNQLRKTFQQRLTYNDAKQDQMIIKNDRRKQKRILQNRFKLLVCLHVIIILAFIFSISYTQWYKLSIKTNSDEDDGYVWLNTLYVYDQFKLGYVSYNEYMNSSKFYCDINKICNCDPEKFKQCIEQNCIQCIETFQILQTLGLFSFICVLISVLLQLIDMFVIVKFAILNQKVSNNNQQDQRFWFLQSKKMTFIEFMTLFFQTTGILGYILYLVFQNPQTNIWDNGKLGLAYYFGFLAIPIYVCIQILKRLTKSLLVKNNELDEFLLQYDEFSQSTDTETINNNKLKNSNVKYIYSKNEKETIQKQNTNNSNQNINNTSIPQISLNKNYYLDQSNLDSTINNDNSNLTNHTNINNNKNQNNNQQIQHETNLNLLNINREVQEYSLNSFVSSREEFYSFDPNYDMMNDIKECNYNNNESVQTRQKYGSKDSKESKKSKNSEEVNTIEMSNLKLDIKQ